MSEEKSSRFGRLEVNGLSVLLEQLDSLGEVLELAGLVRADFDYLVRNVREASGIEAVRLGASALAELVQERDVLVFVVDHALLEAFRHQVQVPAVKRDSQRLLLTMWPMLTLSLSENSSTKWW